ncbi:MAG TPA: AAA family ATPase [Steroidobacteraceae bacterium]|nr:AAA family ATPase [Steroidobacteraceae bacterium]
MRFDAEALLLKSLEGISAESETALKTHIERHQIEEQWLADGIGYVADDRCPFCSRDGVDALRLVQAYRAIFSDAYRDLQNEIVEGRHSLTAASGEVALAGLRTITAQNMAAIEFWRRYCAVDPASFPVLDNTFAACARAYDQLDALLERKSQSPLEPIERSAQLDEAEAALTEARTDIETYNQSITAANALINATKQAAAGGDVAAAQAQLTRLQAVKRRHEPAATQACADYQRLDAEKRAIEQRKVAVRQQLEDHTRRVIRPYEDRINQYLAMFNANFRLVETSHGYPGGIATSTYQLQINGANIDLGDNRTPDDRPSFKNTLSAGDRATLALAFFLSQLEREPDLAERVVIFDDPFSSQDSFRRSQTVYEIMRVARACAQVIVLSHDAQFLKQLWEKCPPAERTAMQFIYHPATGSKIGSFDLDDACRGRAAAELDDLMAFRAAGVGNPREIIKKLRVVLETHFRIAYPGSFVADDNLGAILGKIRAGGDQHPAYAAYDSLDRINDYTAQYHHGEDARGAAEPQLDQTELLGFVNMTLALVNALPA